MKNLILVCVCFVSVAATARPKFRILDFEIGGLRLTQDSGRTSAFIDFAWTPLWDAEDYGFHGNLEVTSHRNIADKRMLVTTAGGSAFLRVYSLINIEATAGVQTWHDASFGTNPILGGAVVMRVGEDLFDRLYIAYWRLLSPTYPTGILRAGFAFNI